MGLNLPAQMRFECFFESHTEHVKLQEALASRSLLEFAVAEIHVFIGNEL